ncbi:MAG: cobalamin-dependent protein [Deltaproteobacteria bacterium]
MLSRTIDQEIIPSLMRAHPNGAGSAEADRRTVATRDVEAFVQLVLGASSKPCRDFVTSIVETSVPLETIFAELLVPAARHIGDLWMNDRCSFADVTIGVGRLQQLLSEYGSSFAPVTDDLEVGRVLLAPAPGEQHTFGLHVVAEFFRRDGWSVSTQFTPGRADLTTMVEREPFAMVGFSVSNSRLFEPLAQVIEDIREASQNPDVVVMVGGAPDIGLEEAAEELGATTHAPDARWAVEYMQRHLEDGSRKRER